jgi:hypothetical protein
MSVKVRVHSVDAENITDELLLSKTYNTDTDTIENLDIYSVRKPTYMERALMAAFKSLTVSGGAVSTPPLSGIFKDDSATEIYSPPVSTTSIPSHPGALPLTYSSGVAGDWVNVSYAVPGVSGTTFANAPGAYIKVIPALTESIITGTITVAHTASNCDFSFDLKFELWSDDASPVKTAIPKEFLSGFRTSRVMTVDSETSSTITISGKIPASLTGVAANNHLVLLARIAEGTINPAFGALIPTLYLVTINSATVLTLYY